MRAAILTGLILASASPAFAVKKPTTPAELLLVSLLQAEINQSQALRSKIKTLNATIDLEERKIAPNSALIAGLRHQLAGLEDQHLVVCNKAIKLAIDAYDLTPPRPTAVLVTGAVGRQATWAPVFVKPEGRMILYADGTTRFFPHPGVKASGITWPDGAVTLTEEAFTTPAMLAAVLLHETVHFEQRTTPGVGDKLSPKQMEFSAHMKMLATKDKLGLASSEVALIQTALAAAMSKPDGGAHFVGGLPEVKPEPVRSGGDDGFLGAIRELQGVTDETRQAVRREREASESRRIREKEERRRRVARWFEDRKRSRDYMWGLADQACSDPASMEVLQGKGEIIPANIDPLDDSYGLADTSGPESLSPCQRSVLDSIDSARHRYARIYAADFAEAARAYRRVHPTLGERLGKIFEGVFAPYQNLAEGRRVGPVIEPGESREPRSYSREPRCFVDSNGVRSCCVANCE